MLTSAYPFCYIWFWSNVMMHQAADWLQRSNQESRSIVSVEEGKCSLKHVTSYRYGSL